MTFFHKVVQKTAVTKWIHSRSSEPEDVLQNTSELVRVGSVVPRMLGRRNPPLKYFSHQVISRALLTRFSNANTDALTMDSAAALE